MSRKSIFLFSILIFFINCKTNHFKKLGLVKPAIDISYLPPEFEESDLFSYNLFELNEPKIFGIKNKDLEIYRLSSIAFGGGNSFITLIKNNDENSIFKYEIGYKKRRLFIKNIKISEVDFKRFTTSVNSFDLHNFPKNNSNNVDDGIQHLLEVYKNGQYSAFVRNNPQTGRSPDLKFLELTKLFYDLK
ncbi:hypothetical protein [Halpernia frigidisoli]|uniref:Uncharacterized protein n=1 Tax=Halpernia frigidisoli TaxID=1125876 RepID=A0A1I3HIX6_9FLAO|nr:hypothetical protein [Halpernia frigidisoli]SFI35738.1 hypothetical protein SAMN05443292_2241 [Halpernia frigidisoli]